MANTMANTLTCNMSVEAFLVAATEDPQSVLDYITRLENENCRLCTDIMALSDTLLAMSKMAASKNFSSVPRPRVMFKHTNASSQVTNDFARNGFGPSTPPLAKVELSYNPMKEFKPIPSVKLPVTTPSPTTNSSGSSKLQPSRVFARTPSPPIDFSQVKQSGSPTRGINPTPSIALPPSISPSTNEPEHTSIESKASGIMAQVESVQEITQIPINKLLASDTPTNSTLNRIELPTNGSETAEATSTAPYLTASQNSISGSIPTPPETNTSDVVIVRCIELKSDPLFTINEDLEIEESQLFVNGTSNLKGTGHKYTNKYTSSISNPSQSIGTAEAKPPNNPAESVGDGEDIRNFVSDTEDAHSAKDVELLDPSRYTNTPKRSELEYSGNYTPKALGPSILSETFEVKTSRNFSKDIDSAYSVSSGDQSNTGSDRHPPPTMNDIPLPSIEKDVSTVTSSDLLSRDMSPGRHSTPKPLASNFGDWLNSMRSNRARSHSHSCSRRTVSPQIEALKSPTSCVYPFEVEGPKSLEIVPQLARVESLDSQEADTPSTPCPIIKYSVQQLLNVGETSPSIDLSQDEGVKFFNEYNATEKEKERALTRSGGYQRGELGKSTNQSADSEEEKRAKAVVGLRDSVANTGIDFGKEN